MTNSEDEDVGSGPSFEDQAAAIRRQMVDSSDEIEFVYNYAKKNVSDPATATNSAKANLKGMKENVDTHMRKYDELWTELGKLHDLNKRASEFPSDDDKKQRSRVRSDYYSTNGKIEMMKVEQLERTVVEPGNVTLTELRPAKNLPKLNLPNFDGQLLQWPKFRDSFTSMVHLEKLSVIEKFQYLRASLKGPAFSVISTFKVEEANYALAWQAMLDTYDNQRLLASAYLDQLLNCKPIQGKATPEALNNFLSSISDNVAAFKQLNIREESEFILFHLSIRCLDHHTRELFEMKQTKDTFPTFTALTKFIRERAMALQLAGYSNPLVEGTRSSNPSHNPQTFRAPKPKTPPKMALITNKSSSPNNKNQPKPSNASVCVACKGEPHHLLNCQVFNETSGQERRTLLKNWSGCVNCLSHRHQVQDCTSKWHCRFCPERHHASIHPSSASDASECNVALQSTSLSAHNMKEEHVILGTAIAKILDGRGCFQTVRMVIDSGSQSSFITHRCLNRLGLKMTKTDRVISGIGQTHFDGAKGKVVCTIKPQNQGSIQITTEAVVVSTITSLLPSTLLPQPIIDKCRGLQLADPTFWKPGTVDFLLGADLFAEIWTGVVKETGAEGPKLLSSIFGFVVMGKIGISGASTASLLMVDSSNDLNFQLERFWQLEEPVPTPPIMNPDDQRCEEHFIQTHYRLESGRYGVRLPFRDEDASVGDSSSIALRRFHSLEKKLKNNPNMQEKYHDFLKEYLELQHMSPATSPGKFMIPHHCIMKETPDGQKLKVVFDASADTPGGSLNNHLLTGCKLQNDIRDAILRFRYHSVVFTTDIIKMFRMIEVFPDDRQYMQIYWRFDSSKPVERFELNTVIYGLVCAPYQAQRVLKQLTIDHGDEFPLAAQALLRDSYVDDILTGASSLPEALALQDQLIQLLKHGGFQLSKWSSNSTKLLKSLASAPTEEPVDLSSSEDQWVKILGLQWDPKSDCFSFSIGEPNQNYTKRGILSTVARLYDPLGFLTPTTFLMKGFIQDLWIRKLDWDQPLTPDLTDSWKTVMKQLPLLSELRIPRFIGTSTEATSCQLVGFSDASSKGYAAVIYLRVIKPDHCDVLLLTSKSKLAPTKTQSIPRLELSGALLLAELHSAILPQIQTLDLLMIPSAFFTDSSIVLAWINTPAYRLKVFVANRVVKIQELTTPSAWKHVISEENPCDVASRGILPSQLLSHDLWWSGPSWISLHPSNWPSNAIEVPSELPEMKTPETNALASVNPPDHLIKWMSRSSTYLALIRAAGWLRRWLYNLKHMKCCCCACPTGHLKKSEFDEGLSMCIKGVQTYYFYNHQQTLKRYADLRPYIDSEGVWRVGGRLAHSSFPESRKHPILLPYDAHLSALIVDHYHRIYLHPGPTTLQAVIQTRFWIPSLRRLIRLRGFQCTPCYKSKALTFTPLMGDLPSYRVNGGRTFQHVGIDFAGPFPLKESNRRNAAIGKVYLCLYVCMATKALHLEAVTRLTTEAFLASFHRFTSRRGIPSDVYTDNGSNFLGAANYLQDLYRWFSSQETKKDLLQYAMDTMITWHFNPPHTPHMGGIWEAGVKSVKRYLRLIASDAKLTYEEISTWFARIEAILNSRPLCPLSTDPNENDYLSPGHFLVGGPLVVAPEPSLLDTKENLLSRWQLVNRMSEQFWQRWSSEYLSTLQRRPKWVQMKKNLELGDLVLLKESTPPLQWKLARVTAVHPGNDDVVRVVTVRRGDSSLRRHVANLVPLPHLSTKPYP
uniref:Integrase catalytic domain-containing protein n=1 Tax=Lygus hesperus TaxID=30085 RepID=A0A0A9Z275_LYGHE